MKKKFYTSIALRSLPVMLLICCVYTSSGQNKNQNGRIKNTTVVKGDDDKEKISEEEEQVRRKAYFENMHRTATGVNWKKIEAQNNITANENMLQSKALNGSYANGNLKGNWMERGSNNQAGRIEHADYDAASNKLYVVSDVGVLYQGVPDSANWHALNDQVKFTGDGLKVVTNGSGHRLVIAAGLNAFYTDDDGVSYKASTGFKFPVEWGGNNVEQIVAAADSKQTMYCIVKEWDDSLWQPLYYLYQSVNKGAKWSRIFIFSEGNDREVVLWSPPGKNFIYALENVDAGTTNTYKIQGTTIAKLNSAPALSNYVPLQFQGVIQNNRTKLYALLASCELFSSNDLGKNWNYVNTVPNVPVEAVFGVSLTDTNKLILGGIPECYTSVDGGKNLSFVNAWTDYYNDVANKLHSDERNIYFFKRSNGTEFQVIVCDGGVYRSDNFMSTVHNIGLKGLNVGEFYDVLADPASSSWLFGGTQDQGFQRTSALSKQGVVDFTQVISGDPGHFQLTRNYQTLWTENAGGQINYYYKSHGSLSNYDYAVPGSFLPEVGWLLPTAEVYPASKNQIFIAGGNINGGDGSYLIKLTGGTTNPYTISQTQFNYDFKSHADGQSGISAIGTTPLDVNKIYVATEDGEFFYSANNGAAWSKSSFIGPYPAPGYGSAVYASKLAAGLVYYGGSGYSNPPVYKSADGGVTFKNMSSGLPATLVYDLIANPDESLLFAATEAGPYVFVVSDSTWYPFSGGIAPLSIAYTSVDYEVATNTVRFSTYGRGIWDFKITAQPAPSSIARYELKVPAE